MMGKGGPDSWKITLKGPRPSPDSWEITLKGPRPSPDSWEITLPNMHALHETCLHYSTINKPQSFLLWLGRAACACMPQHCTVNTVHTNQNTTQVETSHTYTNTHDNMSPVLISLFLQVSCIWLRKKQRQQETRLWGIIIIIINECYRSSSGW